MRARSRRTVLVVLHDRQQLNAFLGDAQKAAEVVSSAKALPEEEHAKQAVEGFCVWYSWECVEVCNMKVESCYSAWLAMSDIALIQVEYDATVKKQRSQQEKDTQQVAPTILSAVAGAWASIQEGPVAMKVKRKAAVATLESVNRLTKITTSGLSVRGVKETDEE